MGEDAGGWWARLKDRKRWGSVLVLLPALILGTSFLNQEQLDPLTVTSLLVDRILYVAVFGLLLAPVFVLLAPPMTAMMASAIASATGVALSATVLLAGIRPPRDDRVLVLAAVALAGCLVNYKLNLAGMPVFRRHATSSILAAALAVVIPLLQFWHSTSFLPGRLSTNLALTPNVSSEIKGDQARGVVEIRVDNSSDVRALIIISDMKVCHRETVEELAYDVVSLRKDPSCRSVRPLGQRSWVDAKGSVSHRTAIETPAGRPLIQMISRVAYARGDRVREVAGSERTGQEIGACQDAVVVALQEESRYKALAQVEKYLVYDTNDVGGIQYSITSSDARTCPKSSSDLQSYFGVTELRVNWEGWVGAPAPAEEGSAS